MGFSSAMMSGVSGLMSNDATLSVIGNNIANVNTTGFKSGRTLFEDMLYKDVTGNRSQIGLGTSVLAVQNQFTQGSFLSSDTVTDLAINGDGFFVMQSSSATPVTMYTRAGTFNLDSKSQYLVNPDGNRLCDSTGVPVDLTGLTNFASISRVAADGTISYLDTDGLEQTSGIRIGIARFVNLDGLEKNGSNNYLATLASGVATTGPADSDTRILYKTLEQSNVDMATEMTSLIITQRAYTANSKSVTTSDEMSKTVISMKR